ncbi:protein BIG GRAIN 1-like A [Nicotiana tomentosiformis]|uniref:Protein BIG GRAIN 1-like A n=1 Tax=Nicotiana tabacum TaxID=4097 RepID=A0A1S3Z497_TOBAC|nr:protein BIG GRAIN 1-like A [Nicotiana tomentosiformis]XP_016459218.1 PREDICTED: protein BIG GRAIN 1-like A [Nicotiana tabacum]
MDRYNYTRERDISHTSNPSFSSTLLDAIYRSIDQGEEEQFVLYKETMRKKQSNNNNMENFQKVCMIEKWMEHKVSEKVAVRRKSAADFERKSRNLMNSSSSSSDSSCGGVFSSNSEAESVYNNGVKYSSGSSCYGLNRPKPIRTSISTTQSSKNLNLERDFVPKMKNEGGFVKTKSKALKIYGDLKKVKQPISPGGRLASFLNSIFTTGNTKKPKVSSSSANTSTCSSASSFSRSCLSKNTPKSSNSGVKRSVRFVDEGCQPNLESVKNIRKTINEEMKFHAMEKNRRVEEAAKELLKNYQKKVEREFDMRKNSEIKQMEVFEDEDYEDDDVASCASSDLFELDNLSSIGIDRYSEELPVYETTNLGTNRAIANGLIL